MVHGLAEYLLQLKGQESFDRLAEYLRTIA
jgi:hypothetical protein